MSTGAGAAVNDAYTLAPWADILYACDSKWWGWHKGVPGFEGQKYTLAPQAAARWPAIKVLRGSARPGLDPDPGKLCTGRNSGYQAINLAVHLGASRILLLGYDMQGRQKHFFGVHPDRSTPPFQSCLKAFGTLVEPLKASGVEIINCTRSTALVCFPRRPLEDVLSCAA